MRAEVKSFLGKALHVRSDSQRNGIAMPKRLMAERPGLMGSVKAFVPLVLSYLLRDLCITSESDNYEVFGDPFG